jgi:site-specific recombinase XerC
LLKTNVAQEIKPVRTVRNICPVGLTEPEIHALLRVAGESKHGLAARNYALVQLMIQAGLRVSEVAALHIGDVVARERSGEVRIRHGKGLKARDVPLNATARRAVRMYLDNRKQMKAEDSYIKRGSDSISASQFSTNPFKRNYRAGSKRAPPKASWRPI